MLPESLIVLPVGFPQVSFLPRFQLGDRVRFVPIPAEDFGIITGLQFAPAEHLQDWAWRYVVWLDDQSPSRAWTCSDLAREDDLQLLASTSVSLMTKLNPHLLKAFQDCECPLNPCTSEEDLP